MAPRAPHRVLVVSSDTGQRHDAAAEAVEEAVERVWPGSETCRVHATDVVGPALGRLLRRPSGRAQMRLAGSWCGRRLASRIERFDPDCIVSTDPLGDAGLTWLRRRRGLTVPVGDWAGPDLASTELDAALLRLAAPPGTASAAAPWRPWRMRSADAFFAYVETAQARQELGVVLELAPRAGSRLTASAVHRALQPRTPGLPPSRRGLVRRHRPGWRLHDEVNVADHIKEHLLDADAGDAAAWDVVGRFWSTPLPSDRAAWEMLLVRGRAHAPDLLAVKMHHCEGDGISALGLLDRLTDPEPADPLTERRPVSGAAGSRLRRGTGPVTVARGLVALATRGSAPQHPLNARPLTRDRDIVGVALPWVQVRALAGEHGVHPHELVIALVADALDRFLRPAGLVGRTGGTCRPLRAMVPVAMRPPRLDRISGNWTGALAVDLPMGEMPFGERVRLVREDVRKRARRGEAPAGSAVVTLVGLLPAPLHRWTARRVYTDRFFNTLVSYMPGARGPRRLAGARVLAYYPVLPPAPRVPVTVGAIVADQVVGIGILLDRGLDLDRSTVADAVRAAFNGAGGRPAEKLPDEGELPEGA